MSRPPSTTEEQDRDRGWLDSIAARDAQAAANAKQLYLTYRGRLMNVVRRAGVLDSDCGDVLNDFFRDLLGKPLACPAGVVPIAWLIECMKRYALRYWQEQGRARAREQRHAQAGVDERGLPMPSELRPENMRPDQDDTASRTPVAEAVSNPTLEAVVRRQEADRLHQVLRELRAQSPALARSIDLLRQVMRLGLTVQEAVPYRYRSCLATCRREPCTIDDCREATVAATQQALHRIRAIIKERLGALG